MSEYVELFVKGHKLLRRRRVPWQCFYCHQFFDETAVGSPWSLLPWCKG